jgi:hypothetical protein
VRTLRAVGLLLVGLAALNVIAVAVLNGYDVRIGPLHLVAHDAFKPLQYLAAAALLAWLLNRSETMPGDGGRAWPAWVTPVCVALVYLPTAFINFLHPDWTQAHIGAAVHGWRDIAGWFIDRHSDGSYRPLGFFSIWLDYLLFRGAPAACHLQSIALHAANAALAAAVFFRLGLSRRAAAVSALLFAIAPVCTEAVTWPAARYDLLAAFFVLCALAAALDWLERGAISGLALVALATAAAILSKETGYAAPLLVAAVAWSRRRLALPLMIATGVPAAVCLAVRLALYHGLGGYDYTQGLSPAVRISARTVFAGATRLLVSPFAVNTADGITAAAAAALVLFAAAVFLGILRRPRPGRIEALLIGLALLSALPTAGLLGWVRPSMLHSRYLYLPAIWIFAALGARAKLRPALALFALASLAGTASNLLYYRQAIVLAERAAVVAEAGVEARPGVKSVCLENLPEEAYGVLYFGSEVRERVQAALQSRGVAVRQDGAACDAQLSFGAMPSAFIFR